MSDLPLVSVCIPCRNAGKYVAEALDSVLGQTYPNIEVIVVDDDSSDESPEVLERYAKRGVTIISEKCGTASRARNRAFREARGEYIKFFDADDILSAEMIKKQVNRLDGRSNAVAMSEWGRFYDDDLASFRPNRQSVWRDMRGVDWLVEAGLSASGMMQAGMFLIPRDLAIRAGMWNEQLTLIDDFEYFSRVLSESEEALFTPGATLFYRSGLAGSLSTRKSKEARASECEAVLLGTASILAKRKDREARLACVNICQHLVYDLYPQYPNLRKRLETRIAECDVKPSIRPSGGRYFNLLRPWVGWKLARRVQRAFGR